MSNNRLIDIERLKEDYRNLEAVWSEHGTAKFVGLVGGCCIEVSNHPNFGLGEREVNQLRNIATRAMMALNEHQAKPCQLKWERDLHEPNSYIAETPVGLTVEIFQRHQSHQWRWDCFNSNGVSSTLDQAKADAQAAWDKLINDCIEPS